MLFHWRDGPVCRLDRTVLENIAMAVGYSVLLPLLLWFGDGGAG